MIAASTPTDCFDAAYWAGKLAVEHMTPVILMTDAFIANGSSAWRLPDLDNYPEIKHRECETQGEPHLKTG